MTVKAATQKNGKDAVSKKPAPKPEDLKENGKKNAKTTPGPKTKAEEPTDTGSDASKEVAHFVKAELNNNGGVKMIDEKEKELKRSTIKSYSLLSKGEWDNEPHEAFVTLTNQRILIAQKEDSPKELSLSSITKAKVMSSGGVFSKVRGKKDTSGATLKLKLSNDTKYDLTFLQPPASIVSAVEERDEFLKLLQEILEKKSAPK